MLPGLAAQAVPLLQLYVEGSTYDPDHESWVFDAALGETFTLWVIGNTAGPGGKGTISDVKLSIVYPDPNPGDGGSLDITIDPTTVSSDPFFDLFDDPSIPDQPIPTVVNEDGDTPTLSDGSSLAPHGVYGPGAEWQEFFLDDFDLNDSPIADFIDAFPTSATPEAGQINAYDITVATSLNLDQIDLHFDAYDHVTAGNHARAVFAPFSHDAGTGINEPEPPVPPADVPEPATLALLSLGLAGIGIGFRRKRKRR